MNQRLRSILFVCLIFTLSCWRVFGQSETRSLSQCLNVLEKKYNVRFAYPSRLINETDIMLNPDSVNLWTFLESIRAVSNLEFLVISDNEILLRQKLESKMLPKSKLLVIQVHDESNGDALELVAVALTGRTIGGYTDENGMLRLPIPEDYLNGKLLFSLLGFQNKEVSVKSLLDNPNVGLSQAAFSIQEIIIRERQELLSTKDYEGSVVLKQNNSQGLSTGIIGNDIFRSLQMLAGISAHNDKSSLPQIRGGGDDETLILLDGIPVYNASHYYGIFSAINSGYADEIAVFKNNIPIEYGGKTSGMVEINSRPNGTSQRLNGILDLNVLYSSAVLNLPVSNNFGLILGGRTTYSNVSNTDLFDLFDNPEEVSSTVQNFSQLSRDALVSRIPDFKFSDYNGKLLYRNGAHQLDLNFYSSRDNFDDNFSNSFVARRQNGPVHFEESYQNLEIWKNKGWSLNSLNQLNSRLKIQTTLFSSSYENENEIETSIERTVVGTKEILGFNNLRQNKIRDQGLRSFLQYSLQENLTSLIGVEIQEKEINLGVSEEARDVLQSNQSASEYTMFGSLLFGLKSGGLVQIGLRSSYYNLTDKVYFAPRWNIVLPIESDWQFKASIGWHNQFVRELNYENIFGRTVNIWAAGGDRGIPVSSSKNFMTGLHFVHGRFSSDMEIYFKSTEGVVEYALVNPSFNVNSLLPISQRLLNHYKLFTGSGETLGMDMTFTYSSLRFQSVLSYTLSKSTVSFRNILKGRDFPSKDDRRHQFKLSNQFYLGKFNLTGNLVYASGRAYTDVASLKAEIERTNVSPEDRIRRLPHYARIDLGLNYEITLNNQSLNLGLTIYNTLDRQNVNYLQYIFSIPTEDARNQQKIINTIIGTQTNLLGRTFNLNATFKF